MTDPHSLSQDWVQEFIISKAEPLKDLVLVDKRSRTPVSHRDVGIGVSQVLPVLVLAYAGANRLICMEQPEIHLHPRSSS
jgi:predicted ATPase